VLACEWPNCGQLGDAGVDSLPEVEETVQGRKKTPAYLSGGQIQDNELPTQGVWRQVKP
jgi:hypothetical protein